MFTDVVKLDLELKPPILCFPNYPNYDVGLDAQLEIERLG